MDASSMNHLSIQSMSTTASYKDKCIASALPVTGKPARPGTVIVHAKPAWFIAPSGSAAFIAGDFVSVKSIESKIRVPDQIIPYLYLAQQPLVKVLRRISHRLQTLKPQPFLRLLNCYYLLDGA